MQLFAFNKNLFYILSFMAIDGSSKNMEGGRCIENAITRSVKMHKKAASHPHMKCEAWTGC